VAKVVFENVYKSFPRRKYDGETRMPTDVDFSIVPQAQVSTGNRFLGQDKPQSTTKFKLLDRVSVLRNINLTVEDGEFIVLVGPSGCGKSTLLRMLAGLEDLTGGSIAIGDRQVNNLPPKARDIAMVFQNYALYPHLNIYDNLAFGLRRTSETQNRGLKEAIDKLLVTMTRSLPNRLRYLSAQEKAVRKTVRYVASLLQIDHLLNRLPKELSGGQKQRVALGRAIARNPQVFLMDEPLSNLDAKLRTQTRSQIVKLQKKLGTTTIYVTHDQTEAMTMGDRIAVMNEGQIQQIAEPLEIYERPANRFVAEFIGSPPMNFLLVEFIPPATLIHPQFCLTLPETWRDSLQPYKERSLYLGIRPQNLHLATASEHNLLVEVDLVEALGNETYLATHLKENINSNLTVSLPPDKLIAVGDLLWLSIDMTKIHLFTEDNGRSILHNL
jgi:multiple sugar transport system ATP-binding protein